MVFSEHSALKTDQCSANVFTHSCTQKDSSGGKSTTSRCAHFCEESTANLDRLFWLVLRSGLPITNCLSLLVLMELPPVSVKVHRDCDQGGDETGATR